MAWWTSPWGQSAGWALLYALAVWGASVIQSLLEHRAKGRASRNAVSWIVFLVPLALSFLIGVRLRSWWWIGGPPVVTMLMTLAYPTLAYLRSPRRGRQNAGPGLALAITLTLLNATVASIAAAAGIIIGKTLLD